MPTVLGIDIGTQGTKAVLVDQRGKCLAQAFEPSQLRRSRPGVVEENPERQYASVCRTIAACLSKVRAAARSVAGIGIAGQMAGILGVGSDGRAVTPYDSWLDTRCGPFINQMQRAAGAAIVASAGNPPSFNHGPKMLWWMHEQPDTFRRIAAFVPPGCYAAMRLCGLSTAEAFVDTTYLHFSGFADTAGCRWNESLLGHFAFEAASCRGSSSRRPSSAR
jgi:xylulokinase